MVLQSLLTALLLAPGTGIPPADKAAPAYAAEARVDHIAAAVAAVRGIDEESALAHSDYIDLMARTACRSSSSPLLTSCLLKVASKRCTRSPAPQACGLTLDLLIVNKVSEARFVSAENRYAIMRRASDYRTALRRTLQRHYAALALNFRLHPAAACVAEPQRCLAAAIDSYCQGQTVIRGLGWHQCTAALVFFIARHSRGLHVE